MRIAATKSFISGILASTMILWSPTAMAGAGLGLHNVAPVVNGARLQERRPTPAPFSQAMFCKDYPTECLRGDLDVDAVKLTSGLWRDLTRVNRAVNADIVPVREVGRGFLGDRWQIEPAEGDCEDFAVTKRSRLIALGWPPGALRVAVVRTPQGEGHAVLVVRTGDADLVLDNLTDDVMNWSDTGLRFIKMQSGVHPRLWISV